MTLSKSFFWLALAFCALCVLAGAATFALSGEAASGHAADVAPTYPGSYPLYFSIEVVGRSGKRVRLWRAQEATERTKAVTTVALLAVGHLRVGGGIRFTIGPLPYDIWAAELPQTPAA